MDPSLEFGSTGQQLLVVYYGGARGKITKRGEKSEAGGDEGSDIPGPLRGIQSKEGDKEYGVHRKRRGGIARMKLFAALSTEGWHVLDNIEAGLKRGGRR